jgi:hypothetical protein
MAMDPEDWRVVCVTDGRRVYMTRNEGDTWLDITGNLSELSDRLYTLRVFRHPTSQEPIVVVGGLGVFRTVNPGHGSGWQWQEVGNNLPPALFVSLRYVPDQRLLLAGSFGRGAWTAVDALAAPSGSAASRV